MKKAIIEYTDQFVKSTKEDKEALLSISKIRKVKKGEIIAIQGEKSDKAFFIKKGVLRFFHVSSKGEEITTDLFFAPGFTSTYDAFFNDTVSQISIQSMTNMDIIELSKKELIEMYSKFPATERMARLATEQVVTMANTHLLILLSMSAKERYVKLIEEYPQYIRDIPLRYLASFLGVTPETMSRMRKAMTNQ